MAEITAIAQALTAVKQATDIVHILRSAETAYERAELKLKISSLAEALANARTGLLEAQLEIQGLKDEIRRVSETGRALVIHRDGVAFIKEGEREAGPFCARCLEVDGRRMPLTKLDGPFTVFGTYKCPQCRQTF